MKYLFSTIIAFLFITNLNAQSFFHGGGLAYQVMIISDSTGTISSSEGGLAYGVAYEARLNVKDINDNLSISVSTLPMLMFNLNANSRTGTNLLFALDIPVMAGINLGALATDESDSSFGFTLNAGYGFSTGLTDSFVTGPVVDLGVRIIRNRDFGIHFTYMPVSNSEISGNSYRASVLYYF